MDRDLKEWYKYIDDLVFKYQSGDKQAAQDLIEHFEGFLYKYFCIVKKGKINFRDRDSRNFIILYIQDKEINRSLRRSRQSTEARAEAHKALSRLRSNCLSIPDEDFRQECIACLLTLAKRYKKRGKKRHFPGYLYNAYRFEIMRRIKYLTRDPVSFAIDRNYAYNDEENITEYEEDLNMANFTEIPSIPGEELDINWIFGDVSSEVFEDLTPFERLVLKLYYVDGLVDHEIATKTGYHRNSIIGKRHQAIDKLARRLNYEEKDN